MPYEMPAPDDVREIERAGIRTLWIERDEPLATATLVFRVGRIDEPYARGGITHLVEHLALGDLADVAYSTNGAVAMDITSFTATGAPEELTAFLGHVAGTLTDLPTHRLEAERRILTAEAGPPRGLDTFSFLPHVRWGYQSIDRRAAHQHALRAADEVALKAWARERFTAAAATLCWVGPEPPAFDWRLPPGAAHPLPAVPPSLVPLPFAVEGDEGVVALGVTLPNHMSARVFTEVLSRRLTHVLRHERGLVYFVDANFEVLTPELAHLSIAIDVGEAHAEEVSTVMLQELRRLAAGEVSAADLEASRRFCTENAASPSWLRSHLLEMAQAAGAGRRPIDVAEELARAVATDSAAITALAREALSTAIHLAPPYVAPPEGWATHADVPLTPPVEGETFSTGEWRRSHRQSLTIGDRGFSLADGNDPPRTVLWADLVAASRGPTGEWNFEEKNGWEWSLAPDTFGSDEARVAALIEQGVDPATVVPPEPEPETGA